MSFTDEEFIRIKRLVETRGRDAAHVTVAPVDTAQYCSPRPPSPEISFGARVYLEKNEEGRMDPEPDQLEPPSAGTGFETRGQQCHPIWEAGRTSADGCLLIAVGSNLGGNTFPPTECVTGTRTGSVTTTSIVASKTAFLQTRRKPRDKRISSEENKQFDPGGKGGEPPPWKAGVPVSFSFLGLFCAWCSCLCLPVCLLRFVSYHQVIIFQRAEKYGRRHESSRS